MDGLPLALDQAGAYADETGCSLAKYLEYYQTQCTKLLKRRGRSSSNHPASVAATWSLSFERVEQQNAVAADLLRLCAFLAPDAIPEEIITGGAPYLGEHLQAVSEDQTLLDEAIGVLRAYSLIRRNATEKTLSIHRLVQAVLRDAMDEQSQRQWAERAVLAVSKALPPMDVSEGYLPHAQVCANLVKQQGMMIVEAARLLNNTGHYLYRYADYTKAEPLYKQGLEIYEKLRGSEHPGTVLSLKNLAKLYYAQKQYSEARSLYQQALDITKRRGDTYPGLPAFVDCDIPLEFDLLVWNATLKTRHNNARARETDWFKEYYTILGQEIWEAVIEFNLEESNLKKIEVIVKGGVTQLDGKSGHSPVSLQLNEHPAFVSNFTMPGSGVHMMAKSWDVPLEQLICGSNTLTLTVASDARSCFWLYLLYVGLKEDAIL
jgi:tetratricopeptide (TPR) repeat protein